MNSLTRSAGPNGVPVADTAPKLIYFAERRPEMDSAAFRARWREHARLGMSMPRWVNITRYSHCDTVDAPSDRIPVTWCDGVAVVVYQSEAHRLRHVSDTSATPLMKADERETFARPVRDVAIVTESHTFMPCAPGGGKLFLRLWRRSGCTPEDFREWWMETAGPALLKSLEKNSAGAGYVQNHARSDVTDRLCDCVDEIGYDETDACDRAIADVLDALSSIRGHLGDVRAIWTWETVLHDAEK